MTFEEIMKTDNSYLAKYNPNYDSLQANARELCYEFNNTRPSDSKKRMEIIKKLFGSCPCDIAIESSFRCDYGFNIHAKGFALINYNCVILDTSPVYIGKNVFIAPNVCISCAGHALIPEQRVNDALDTSSPITIEDNVWIGANTTVCGGVTIGEGSVIGAGSVVNKNIPAGVIAVGNPCKVLRKITEADRLDFPKGADAIIYQ